MPTSGIRIVKETNLGSSFPTTLVPTTVVNCKEEDAQDQLLFQDYAVNNNVLVMQQDHHAINNMPTTTSSPTSGKTFVNLNTKNWQGGFSTIVTPATAAPPAPIETPAFAEIIKPSSGGRQQQPRRGGGRRSVIKEEDLSPDESARLALRRERNKQAAARCRKRRLDQTESLQQQVDEHEEKKRLLQEEIHNLQTQKEELEYILSEHSKVCARAADLLPARLTAAARAPCTATRTQAVQPPQPPMAAAAPLPKAAAATPKVIVKSEAPEITGQYQVIHLTHEEALNMSLNMAPPAIEEVVQQQPQRPSRPLSLSIKPQCMRSIAGIPIETPTNGFSSLNFEALMDGRTGLTPTTVLTPVSSVLQTPVFNSPSCSSQQRNIQDSPDNVKLVSL